MGHIARELAYYARLVGKVICGLYLPLAGLFTLLYFPYDTDAPATTEMARNRPKNYYEAAYAATNPVHRGVDYEETARRAAEAFDIDGTVRGFVKQYGLADKRILEVGSGRGYLQDIVPDYTGLDISGSVASRYHKPFVVASATAMPFPDNSFDAVWTVWVLEHIPEPEAALREMRRVLKPGGMLFLAAAWNCAPWAADGFDVRPYGDFNWRGKLVKASILPRSLPPFVMLYQLPTRGIRWLEYQATGEKTRLHFRRLEPDYQVYWEPDSDAAVSVDRYEAYLWFRSRGDECLSYGNGSAPQLVFRVRK